MRVYLGSGVTRPNRPGIDVDAEPPAVKMNDQLGGILTYKLKAGAFVHAHVEVIDIAAAFGFLSQPD